MYDHLYEVLYAHNVAVEVHADHPTLNARVAQMLAAGERLDLISTHSKYAPAQRRWLRPLDTLIAEEVIASLAQGAIELCRYDSAMLCAPRLIDVRVLWVRTDRVERPPDTWSELLESDVVFGFTGRESGLFGLFFELVVGAGGRLFSIHGQPEIESLEAERAVATIVRLAARAPDDLPGWHYDDVDAALLAGRVDAAAAWPGGWGPIGRSPIADVLYPFFYPAGPDRRVSYSGCHAWAIPVTCGDVDAAAALLTELLEVPAQAIDAAGGSMVANVEALAGVQPTSDADARRMEITRATIATSMITYPPFEDFPTIEDAGWAAINAAIRGTITSSQAVREIQQCAERTWSTPT